MDLEIRHLQLVAAVAQHQSLTRAGETLHLSQSALSHQLRDIEDRLGTRLFYRVNRRMSPTPAGQRLIDSATTVLAELRATEDAIRTGLGVQPIPLRISTECNTCYHWLPAVLKPMRERFPQVDVTIDPASTSDPVARLVDGKLDLAIVSSEVKTKGVAVKPLFEDEWVLVVALDHPLAKRPHVRLTDFRRERLLAYSELEDNHFATRVLRPAGVLPARIDVVKLTEAAIELARAGLGVAVLARWAVEPAVRAGCVRALRITSDGYRKHWVAVVRSHLAEADYISEFVRLVKANAPGDQVRKVVAIAGRPRRRARVATFAPLG